MLPTGEPKSVKVKVGFGDTDVPQTIPEIDVQPPKLTADQFTGTEAVGKATNESPVTQEFLTFFRLGLDGAFTDFTNTGVAARRTFMSTLQ